MNLSTKYIYRKLKMDQLGPGMQKYLFNTGWMFAEKALRLVAGLLIGAYVARYLGPGKYGLLNYAISIVSLFSAVSGLGLDQVMIRELIRLPEKNATLLGTGFLLKLAASTLILLAASLVIWFSGGGEAGTLVLIIGGGILCESSGVIDLFFQSIVQSKYVVWAQMISLSIISIVRIYLVLTHAPLRWFAWTYTLDYLLVALGLAFFYSRKFVIRNWKFSPAIAKIFLKNSWPLIFGALSITIYLRIDQIMIKWMLGDAATGQYGVAVRLSELWNFIPVAICTSIFPAILNAKKVSEEFYLSRLQQLFDLMAGISIAIAIPMTFLSGILVRFLFGEAYADAGPVLSLYIWSGVFVFLGVANARWIISENMQKFMMFSLVSASAINIVLNLLLIRYIGLAGSALATLVAYSFASYFSFLFNPKARTVFISLSRSLNIFRLIKNLVTHFRIKS